MAALSQRLLVGVLVGALVLYNAALVYYRTTPTFGNHAADASGFATQQQQPTRRPLPRSALNEPSAAALRLAARAAAAMASHGGIGSGGNATTAATTTTSGDGIGAVDVLPGGADAELLCVDRHADCSVRGCVDALTREYLCKDSCGTCAATRAAAAAETALQLRVVRALGACGDLHPSCKGWAAAGKCDSEPQGMLQLCQRACAFCTRAPPAPPPPPFNGGGGGGNGWLLASAGSPPPPLCGDDISVCPFLAKTGMCDAKSSEWVALQCRLSCKQCEPQPPEPVTLKLLHTLREAADPNACLDYHPECARWAAESKCISAYAFMHMHCRHACGSCSPPPAPPPPPASPPPPPPPPPPTAAGLEAQKQRIASEAAAIREARLAKERRRAAEAAARGARAADDAAAARRAREARAKEMREARAAAERARRAAAHANATAAAAAAGAAPLVHLWGKFDGSDEFEPQLMQALPSPNCADEQPGECKGWAAAGDCARNAGFMLSRCRASCGACVTYKLKKPFAELMLPQPLVGSGGSAGGGRGAVAAAGGAAAGAAGGAAVGAAAAAGAVVGGATATGAATAARTGGSARSAAAMPAIGFGTAGLGDLTKQAVADALSLGYRLLDSAEAPDWYREADVGAALAESADVSRDEVFLTSKIHPRDLGAARTREAAARSRQKLGVEFHDLLLLHYPACFPGVGPNCTNTGANETWRDSWRELEHLLAEGKAKAIGVSNFDYGQMLELLAFAAVPPAALEARSDPLEPNTALLNLCLQRGVVFIAYSSLGTQWEGAAPRNAAARNPVLNHPAIKAEAEELERSPAQVVLRWALARGVAVLPRSADATHMEENLDAAAFELPAATLKRVNALEGTKPVYGDGDGGGDGDARAT